MLDINNILKILNSYNINSHKYGPTIYQENNNLGICLDIKDSTFGFLTRAFTFNDESTLNDFLKKFIWYKKNNEEYNVELTLDKYDIKNPTVKYTRNNKELSLEEMLNIKEIISAKTEEIAETDNKNGYLINIHKLTEYIINLKNENEKIKNEKNALKIEENDLKYQLLIDLSKYYGRNEVPLKKAVSLENIVQNNDAILLENNAKNIANKTTQEMKNYLTSLIDIAKTEEINDKNLINIYSNSVYKYNIEILKKQIEFVKSKIQSEKNFSLRGSKIHNIDEELKSFLKTDTAPTKIEIFLEEQKTKINNKYNSIQDILDSYKIISGNSIEIPKTIIPKYINKSSIISNLKENFDNLNKDTKAQLILYNSLYKNICNFIIDNNYPEIETIKKEFDFDRYYKDIEEIIFNENNSHYLINYFNIINFKTIDTYINSLIEICKTIENTKFNLIGNLKVFHINENTKYKAFTLNAIYNSINKIYLVDLPTNTNLLYIPEKIEIDEDSKEITIIPTGNLYINTTLIDTKETITVNKYNKIDEKYNNSDIIITKDLTLNKSTIFHIGNIEGVN